MKLSGGFEVLLDARMDLFDGGYRITDVLLRQMLIHPRLIQKRLHIPDRLLP